MSVCSLRGQMGVAFLDVWSGRTCETFSLSEAEYTIGSDADSATLVIDNDPCISGVHAILERVNSRWSIMDLGSRNETKVNRERLIQASRPLRHGDEIVLGRTRLVFRDPPPRRRGRGGTGVREPRRPTPSIGGETADT